jgi:hypothetical protein
MVFLTAGVKLKLKDSPIERQEEGYDWLIAMTDRMQQTHPPSYLSGENYSNPSILNTH